MKLIDTGPDARGIIAIGTHASGVVALGQHALGFVAIGQVARGFIAIGQLAMGVVAIGQAAMGLGFAVGMVAGGAGPSLAMLGFGATGTGMLFGRVWPRRAPGSTLPPSHRGVRIAVHAVLLVAGLALLSVFVLDDLAAVFTG